MFNFLPSKLHTLIWLKFERKNHKHHPEKSGALLALYLSRLIGKSSLGKRVCGAKDYSKLMKITQAQPRPHHGGTFRSIRGRCKKAVCANLPALELNHSGIQLNKNTQTSALHQSHPSYFSHPHRVYTAGVIHSLSEGKIFSHLILRPAAGRWTFPGCRARAASANENVFGRENIMTSGGKGSPREMPREWKAIPFLYG